jgi:hypothetical protein
MVKLLLKVLLWSLEPSGVSETKWDKNTSGAIFGKAALATSILLSTRAGDGELGRGSWICRDDVIIFGDEGGALAEFCGGEVVLCLNFRSS